MRTYQHRLAVARSQRQCSRVRRRPIFTQRSSENEVAEHDSIWVAIDLDILLKFHFILVNTP